jgi:hypothetical protein
VVVRAHRPAVRTLQAQVNLRLVLDWIDALGRGNVDSIAERFHPDCHRPSRGTRGDHHGLDAWRPEWERPGDIGFREVSVTVEQKRRVRRHVRPLHMHHPDAYTCRAPG